jgi:hypothetical protein
MPAPKPKSKVTVRSQGPTAPEKWPFGRKNYLWFGIALVTMILGFILLGSGSVTWAPLLLVIAYCVLVPVAILIKDEPKPESTETTEPTA